MKLFYNRTAKQLLFVMVCFFPLSLFSQNVFWSEDFQNGVPSDWSNYEVNNPIIKWTWTTNTIQGLVSGQPHFASNTVGNGFMMFNSNALGNYNHDARLVTSSIDCSNQSSVWIHFQNQFAFFSPQSMALLGVSTDSVTWTYDTLFTNLVQNQTDLPLQIEEFDISNIAANQANVYLQFRWLGNDEYSWRLDDIRLQNGVTPPPNHNLEIIAFAIPSNYATPLAHLKPIEMGVFVENKGLMDAHNVKLKTTIYNDDTDIILYEDSTSVSLITSGNSAVLALTNFYTPPSIDVYRLEYDLWQDSTDAFPLDNHKESKFIISDTLFSKDNNTGFGSAKPSVSGDYMIGNVYQIQTNGHYADQVIFNCGHPSGIPLNGFAVDVFLYEIDSTVALNLSDFSDNKATQVGIGSYSFNSSHASFSFFTTDIRDFNGDKVPLKANRNYFIMLSFTGSSSVLDIGISDDLSYSTDYATILNLNNSFILGGFGTDITAIVRMTITSVSPTKELELFKGKVNVFPNPTFDNINVNIQLENDYSNTKIEVLDVLGKVIYTNQWLIFGEKNIEIDASSWNSGIYFIKIQTETGKITKRIVVE